jgi:hypothetical protein
MMRDMVAHLVGARLQGDDRPALEILARLGLWPAGEVLRQGPEAEREAGCVLRESACGDCANVV